MYFSSISTDFDSLNYKGYDLATQKFVTYACPTKWKQRIGFDSSEIVSVETKEKMIGRFNNSQINSREFKRKDTNALLKSILSASHLGETNQGFDH